ncbi:Root phototropism protein 3 [Linum grandiflorum]
MKKISLSTSAADHHPPPSAVESCWFDDACILDMDYFVKTITGIKSKGVRPDLIGSIIAHYASKWLPELSPSSDAAPDNTTSSVTNFEESVTSSLMKKRFFVETLVGILPGERDSVPCNFLLRLLRTANAVGAEPGCVAELEARVAWQLDGASLKELMIPNCSFSGTTVLDVELVTRLVKMFVTTRAGAEAAAKVGKLVDGYLAEVAADSKLGMLEFVSLAASIPHHARSSDDGLYRAIDTYLKAHPGVSKQERKSLCRLIDSRKLSPEASYHASHNERLPVRVVIQVLFAEQTKLTRQLDWSGSSFNDRSSPNPRSYNAQDQVASSTRCHSKREEIRKLKEDVLRLQSQCIGMQNQMGRMMAEKKKSSGHVFSYWKKLGFSSTTKVVEFNEVRDHGGGGGGGEGGMGKETPVVDNMKAKLVKKRTPPHRWRKSMS